MTLLLSFLVHVGAWDKPPEPGLPWLHLAGGLPPHERCRWACAESWRWWSDVQRGRQAQLWAPGWWFEYMRRGTAWNYARDATNVMLPWLTRRRAIRGLAREAGWRAVVTGELPAPVPLEWYREN